MHFWILTYWESLSQDILVYSRHIILFLMFAFYIFAILLCIYSLLYFILLYTLPLHHNHSTSSLCIASLQSLSHFIFSTNSFYYCYLHIASLHFLLLQLPNICLPLILLSLHCSALISSTVKYWQSRIVLDSRSW